MGTSEAWCGVGVSERTHICLFCCHTPGCTSSLNSKLWAPSSSDQEGHVGLSFPAQPGPAHACDLPGPAGSNPHCSGSDFLSSSWREAHFSWISCWSPLRVPAPRRSVPWGFLPAASKCSHPSLGDPESQAQLLGWLQAPLSSVAEFSAANLP